jgi:RAD50-interacting protein 1
LLAHTIYQSLIFDNAVRESGFSLKTTTGANPDNTDHNPSKKSYSWEGLSNVILGKQEWFDAWVDGESKCKFSSLISVR